jgi:Lipocalin-like domain
MKALPTISIAAALTCAASSLGAAESLKQQLVGTWTVVSFLNENEKTGRKTEVKVFGSNPKGYFMFDAGGHFAINLIRAGRPKFGYRDFPTRSESKAALEGTITMFGDYKVNESEHSISLHIIGGSFPTWDDSRQKRFISINGDELTYKNPTPASGAGTAVVTLKRAADVTD